MTASTTLVTGASGLVGSHVTRLLCERGDRVRVTVREGSATQQLAELDVEQVRCDVLDRRAVRRALAGVERVFHVAGLTSLRASPRRLYDVNVEGTRIVCEEALRAGVQRLVLTSSVAAVGPAARHSTADESQPFEAADLGVPYVAAKREAEAVAMGIGAQGLPLVVVNPAHVLGPGDVYRSSTDIVRRFLRREIPAYVDGAICIVHVADVARGHLLADERGAVGERYILGNRNFTLDRFFADLSRLSGVEGPRVKLPMPAALALAEAAERLPGRPIVTRTEILGSAQWWSYRSAKARRELGYTTRHHEDALVQTIEWYRDREGSKLARPGTRQPAALRLTGFGLRRTRGVWGMISR